LFSCHWENTLRYQVILETASLSGGYVETAVHRLFFEQVQLAVS
jgi:hypothetical protein